MILGIFINKINILILRQYQRNLVPNSANSTELSGFEDIDGLVQDCSISIGNALEILQFCTKPLIYDKAWDISSKQEGYGCLHASPHLFLWQDVSLVNLLTHFSLDKMATILQITFSNAFSHDWKVLYLDLNFTEVCSYGSKWQ